MAGVQPALAAPDTRMQIQINADEEKGISQQYLQTHVKEAADMALPALWPRIVPQQYLANVPGTINSMLFLQRATPNEQGMSVVFQARRVFAWLDEQQIPAIRQAPAWSVRVNVRDEFGNTMNQPAARLTEQAEQMASALGFATDSNAPALTLDWRWLDRWNVNLSAHASTGDFSETRSASGADPVELLTPWLIEALLKARDATVLATAVPITTAPPTQPIMPTGPSDMATPLPLQPLASAGYLQLKVMRQASLAEQVLFEQDLRQDQRILDLSLKQVTRDGQQYRLRLRGGDSSWLQHWFSLRGMMLTPTIDGWVASRDLPVR